MQINRMEQNVNHFLNLLESVNAFFIYKKKQEFGLAFILTICLSDHINVVVQKAFYKIEF